MSAHVSHIGDGHHDDDILHVTHRAQKIQWHLLFVGSSFGSGCFASLKALSEGFAGAVFAFCSCFGMSLGTALPRWCASLSPNQTGKTPTILLSFMTNRKVFCFVCVCACASEFVVILTLYSAS